MIIVPICQVLDECRRSRHDTYVPWQGYRQQMSISLLHNARLSGTVTIRTNGMYYKYAMKDSYCKCVHVPLAGTHTPNDNKETQWRHVVVQCYVTVSMRPEAFLHLVYQPDFRPGIKYCSLYDLHYSLGTRIN